MKPALLLCFLLLAVPAYARLDETTEQIEARYGKPLSDMKPESPATVARVYEKNGFRIAVGFYEGKSYYEQFQKIDPQKPNSFLEITETERNWLLLANDTYQWGNLYTQTSAPFSSPIVSRPPESHPIPSRPPSERYWYSSGNTAEATYRDKVFTICSLRVESQKAADEKKRLEENLKDF